MTNASGRDQREPMERLVRIVTALHHAGRVGVPVDKLLEVAGFEGGKDPGSQLARELRHLRGVGWQIDNVSEAGLPAVYRMTTVDNRLKLRLTGPQQAALQRAVLLADRSDLVERLGLPPATAPTDFPAIRTEHHEAELAGVIRAVRGRCLLHFRYNGSERVVHPESVRAQNATWYLRGHEDGSETVKMYVVSRMLDVRTDSPGTGTSGRLSRHPGLHPMSWEFDPPVDVTLQSPVEYAPDVRRWLGDPIEESERDGVVIFVYRVTHRFALRSRVYQLGTRVTVVGPDDIRHELLDELAVMAGE